MGGYYLLGSPFLWEEMQIIIAIRSEDKDEHQNEPLNKGSWNDIVITPCHEVETILVVAGISLFKPGFKKISPILKST